MQADQTLRDVGDKDMIGVCKGESYLMNVCPRVKAKMLISINEHVELSCS